MAEEVEIVELDPQAAAEAVGALAAVLVDCVAGGASVNFMASFSQADAEAFFSGLAQEVAHGQAALLAARIGCRILGTVNLGLATPPNQPHRADVRKLLVHRDARSRGIGEALVSEIERLAMRRGRTLLVLDTVTGQAGERLYRRLGWTEAGVIPGYALFPDGEPCSTTIFWKRVSA